MLEYDDYDVKNIYKRMIAARKSRGMSQEGLALKMGYQNRNAIANLEAGKIKIPSLRTLCRIASALSCDLDYLLGVLPEGTFRREAADVCTVTDLSVNAVEQLIKAKEEGYVRVAEFISILLEYRYFSRILKNFYDYYFAKENMKSYEDAGQPIDEQYPKDDTIQRLVHSEKESIPVDVIEYRFSRQWAQFLQDWEMKYPDIE